MGLKRGDLVYVVLGSKSWGSEQRGTRPAVVIQNDVGNKFSPTIIVAFITSKTKANLPTHVEIKVNALEQDSIIMLEQVRTLDKGRVLEKVGALDSATLAKVNKALLISLGLKGGDY